MALNLNKKLKSFRDDLKVLCDNVFHYHTTDSTDEYIVWMEDGEASAISSDNGKEEQEITIFVDLYTKKEYSELVDDLQDLFQIRRYGFQLNAVQFEEDTSFIHYTWQVQV